MDPNRAIQILTRQLDKIREVSQLNLDNSEFKKWRRDTEVAIERIFGNDTRHLGDFQEIYFHPLSLGDVSEYDEREAFQDGFTAASAVLESMIGEIRDYPTESDIGEPDALSTLERICLRFHLVARQLRSRHNSRDTLEIEDEYDVQDLLHALLKVQFDDIRAEEYTPSYAGGSSRVDFLLKDHQIVVEVKKTRQGLDGRQLGNELIVDIKRYQSHPDCKCLVCFIYDPEGRVGNPAALERDLEANAGELKVRVIVGPKGL